MINLNELKKIQKVLEKTNYKLLGYVDDIENIFLKNREYIEMLEEIIKNEKLEREKKND